MIMLQRLVTDTLIVILVFLLPITVQLMMSIILINYNDHGVRISSSGSISGISGISRAFADSSSGYGNGRQLETLDPYKIDGGGRNDILIGAENDDILSGEDGDDTLFGETGNDILKGGPGADNFICGPLIDTVLDYAPSQGDTISNDCEIVNTIQQ